MVNISEACRDELGDGGAVAVLLAVAADPVHPNLMQRDALLGLSALCAGHYDNKVLAASLARALCVCVCVCVCVCACVCVRVCVCVCV